MKSQAAEQRRNGAPERGKAAEVAGDEGRDGVQPGELLDLADLQAPGVEEAASAAELEMLVRATRRRALEAEKRVAQLEALLRERDEQLRIFNTHRAYVFAHALAEFKQRPSRSWRLPLELAKLALAPSARQRLRQLAEGPARAVGGVAEILVEQPLRRLPDVEMALRRVRGAQLLEAGLRSTAEQARVPWPAGAPLVSVIIPCFNYGQYLPDALRSLDAQTLQDFEIILVEGGSTDGTTRETVRALEHPKVRKVFQQQPTAVGENRLAGLQLVRGRYVMFLDADDMIAPTYLEKAVMALELTGVDVVYPAVQLFGQQNWVWETAEEFCLDVLARENGVATVAMFRAETWRRLEIGYGTNVHGAVEDWDFWLRFAERGARGYKLREPLMLYRIHGNSLSDAIRPRQAEAERKTLADHWRFIGPQRVKRISRQQRALPHAPRPAVDLPRLRSARPHPLRLGLATPWLAMGGSDNLMLQIFKDCEQQDASLCVYSTISTPPSMGSSAPAFRALTPDVFELSKTLPDPQHAEAIVHLLRSREVNLLMIVGSPPTYDLLPRLRRELPELRVVDHLYNTVGHLQNNRLHAGEIDFHIVANEEVRQALLAAGEAPERIEVVHHGIDMGRFSPDEVPYQAGGFADLPLEPGEKLVLYAGRFSEEKGVLRFVEIARQFQSLPGVRFAMVGDGPQRPEVEALIGRYRLQHHVPLLGIVPDARPYLRRADVVVIPSDVEGLPLVCLEALALGTPVVASRVGALPEAITEGRTGFLAEPADVGSFVEALRRALKLDPDRAALARTCRGSVVERFSITAVRNQYFDVFRRLVSPSTVAHAVEGSEQGES